MSSALGKALGMTSTYTWAQVVSALTGVANKGSYSKTFTPTTSKQTASSEAGYYSGISLTCNAVSLSGNATAAQVLTGKTFYNTTLSKVTGTMANNGAVSASITTSGGSYTIPAGYHNGSGKVTGPTLTTLNTNATFSSGGATLMTSTSTTATTSNKTISGSGLLIVIASCGVSSNFTFTPSASKVSGTGTLTSKLTFSNASCFSGAQVLQNVRIYSVSGASSLVYKASVTGTSGCGWIGIAAFFVKM